ncbi:hypothetical protein [Nonomuraea sp. B1E8]|uniref:hypothetical protein n=1 Tax=unclassified Nonomuraea TaxID=2593643 RepID=UPI00325F24E6
MGFDQATVDDSEMRRGTPTTKQQPVSGARPATRIEVAPWASAVMRCSPSFTGERRRTTG